MWPGSTSGRARARAGEAAYRDYFLVFEDRETPDAYERTLPEVFPDFARQLHLGRRPRRLGLDDLQRLPVGRQLGEPRRVLRVRRHHPHLANHGVEVFRLDAIAFIWKRMGTSCQNQPEVHAITQALRTVARIAWPATTFKAEAIVGPHDLLPTSAAASTTAR